MLCLAPFFLLPEIGNLPQGAHKGQRKDPEPGQLCHCWAQQVEDLDQRQHPLLQAVRDKLLFQIGNYILLFISLDIWSTWRRSTWRRTIFEIGSASWPPPRRPSSSATSRSTMRITRRKRRTNKLTDFKTTINSYFDFYRTMPHSGVSIKALDCAGWTL